MSDSTNKAVFLSYASQDAEAAKRICDALRAAGVEVWFDQSELVGGDAWDAKIRKQIKDCAIFVPIISANTQARAEGYFRFEWRLADKRTELMGKSRTFLLPVCIDSTRDSEADVPDSFNAVQWTRLPGGETPSTFCARVKSLLVGDSERDRRSTPLASEAGSGDTAPQKKSQSRSFMSFAWISAAVVVLAAVGLLVWQFGRRPAAPSVPPVDSTTTLASTELAQLRARIVPERWQKGDFEAIAPALDRLIEKNPDDAEAWALRSIVNSLQISRNLDMGTKPLEAGRAAAERALRLAPESPLAHLALGLHLVANVSRGGDLRVFRESIDRAVAALPPDALTRYVELVSFWLPFDFENSERVARAWQEADPESGFPAWIMSQLSMTTRRPADLEKWSEQAIAAQNPVTTIRALCSRFDGDYYLQADLAAARATLERIPLLGRTSARVAFCRWLLAMAEKNWDQALQLLATLPDAFLIDVYYNGPKALLAGLAHQGAGRKEAALTQFREAERLLREQLAVDPDNEALRVSLAVTLASAGQTAEARRELALIEPLVGGRPPLVYRTRLVVSLAQTYGALGDYPKMARWLRVLFAEPSGVPLTPASFRHDVRFNQAADAPEIQALLKEFAHLDRPAGQKTVDHGRKTEVSAPIDQKSVAVLAFANLSDDKANEYFSDGISEELLNVLGRVPGLRVAAPLSAFSFKGKNVSAQEIGQKLNVAYLVNGSVRRAGTAIRVVARLSRAGTDEQIWTEKFDGEAKDVFALQDEIAGKIAAALSLKLGASARAAKPIDPEAYRLYLEGRHFWSLRTFGGFDRAEVALKQAVALEPESALIRAGLAELYATRGWYRAQNALDPGNNYALASAEAERAGALDPENAQAILVRATIAIGRWQSAEAARLLQHVLALAPNDAAALNRLGDLMVQTGRLDAAVDNYQRGMQLDPLSVYHVRDVMRQLLYSRRYRDVIETVDRFEAGSPRDWRMIVPRAQALVQMGRTDQAAVELRAVLPSITPDDFFSSGASMAELVFSLRVAKCEPESEALAKQLLDRHRPGTYLPAMVLAARGRMDEALPLLVAFPVGSEGRLYWSAIFDPVREDPRFLRKIEEMPNAAEYKVARETLARMLKEQEVKK